jgi:hypothetical protein
MFASRLYTVMKAVATDREVYTFNKSAEIFGEAKVRK